MTDVTEQAKSKAFHRSPIYLSLVAALWFSTYLVFKLYPITSVAGPIWVLIILLFSLPVAVGPILNRSKRPIIDLIILVLMTAVGIGIFWIGMELFL